MKMKQSDDIKNFPELKTITCKLIGTKNTERFNTIIGDVVELNNKLIFIENESVYASLNEYVEIIKLEIIDNNSNVLVDSSKMSNAFKKVLAEGIVTLNSSVVLIVKSDGIVNGIQKEIAVPYINQDGFAVIKSTKSRYFRKESKVFNSKEWSAIKRFQTGERWAISTAMDEDTILAGYGTLTNDGEFEYPLPTVYIKQIYNTLSVSELNRRRKELSII